MIIQQLTDRVFVCTDVVEDWAVMYKTAELFRSVTADATVDITEYVYKQQVLDTVRRNVEHLLSTEAIQNRIQLHVAMECAEPQVAEAPVVAVFVANFGTAYTAVIKDGEKILNIDIKNNSAVFVRDADKVMIGYPDSTTRCCIYINWILTAQ
jgi:hypothetical protein